MKKTVFLVTGSDWKISLDSVSAIIAYGLDGVAHASILYTACGVYPIVWLYVRTKVKDVDKYCV